MKIDLLAIGVHPDDVELSCGGTLLAQKERGCTTAILDLTAGELGTRGTAETRLQEAEAAGNLLGIATRENLAMADGFFENNRTNQLKIIEVLRRLRPDIVLANAIDDRHPDHGRAARLTYDAVFLAGLRRIETEHRGEPQEAWRPRLLLNYIQDRWIEPDVVVDISDHIDRKMEAVRAFASQFYSGNEAADDEPQTYISSKSFFDGIRARAAEMGRACRFDYAEGFTSAKLLGVRDLRDVF